ncbi:FkbM family methyltransferase [Methylomonas sp. CM2]|uniref:FkbM family methyltransferase n=1 Tax=Methylomonas sp. CM2 TaxID=3417647 RepID=UPI003CE85A63
MSLLKSILKISRKIREPWLESAKWVNVSYAQEGEDLVIDRLMGNITIGFYVEVGAHHPFRFSNTYLFYRRGWRGICIDPLPHSKLLFNKWRPRDLAIEIGVSRTPSSLKYYVFNESALNTFDPLLAKQRDGLREFKLIETKQIETLPLANILDNNLPPNQTIDFLSIDAEGFDLEILQSNNWSKYRPNFLIIELLNTDLTSTMNNPANIYLNSIGYQAHAKTGNSVIFAKK